MIRIYPISMLLQERFHMLALETGFLSGDLLKLATDVRMTATSVVSDVVII